MGPVKTRLAQVHECWIDIDGPGQGMGRDTPLHARGPYHQHTSVGSLKWSVFCPLLSIAKVPPVIPPDDNNRILL